MRKAYFGLVANQVTPRRAGKMKISAKKVFSYEKIIFFRFGQSVCGIMSNENEDFC